MTQTFHADTTVGGDGSDYTNDADPVTGLYNGRHRVNFFPMLNQALSIAIWVRDRALDVLGYVADATAEADRAASEADAAAASAVDSSSHAASAAALASALVAGNPACISTSTTSMALTAGVKTFALEPGKSFGPGMLLKFYGADGFFMIGELNAYDSVTGDGAATVDETLINGTGTYSAWSVTVATGADFHADLRAYAFFIGQIVNN